MCMRRVDILSRASPFYHFDKAQKKIKILMDIIILWSQFQL